MNQKFKNAARTLVGQIDYNPDDFDTITCWLSIFALHIIENMNPVTLQAGATNKEILAAIPDMKDEHELEASVVEGKIEEIPDLPALPERKRG